MPKLLNQFIILIILINAIIVLSKTEITMVSNSNSNNSISRPYFKSSNMNGPINIDGNTDFINQAHNNGWNGNGSQFNPIIINNLQIKTSTQIGISIQNTNLFFVVSNCDLQVSPSVLGNGVLLENVQHGSLINNLVFQGNVLGFNIISSSNLTIKDNIVENNAYGAFLLSNSSDNLLLKNTGLQNDDSSFQFETESNNNTVINNLASSSSTGFGFYILDSNYNLFFHNQVDNFDSLAVSLSGNLQYPIFNNFSYNNFINNSKDKSSYQKQAWCYGKTNIIDHNYWSDLTGPDQDGDGIVDIPYTTLGTGVNDSNPVTTPYQLLFFIRQMTFNSNSVSTSVGQENIIGNNKNNYNSNNTNNYTIFIWDTLFILVGLFIGWILLSKRRSEISAKSNEKKDNQFNFKKLNTNKDQISKKIIEIIPSCPHCGEPLLNGDLFCHNCGNRI